MPIETGTAMSSAMTAVCTVLTAIAATPNFGGVSPVNQFFSVRKLDPSARIAGTALAIRNTAIAMMMTSTTVPAAVVVPRNSVSAPKRRLRGSAPPPPGIPTEVVSRVSRLNADGPSLGQVANGGRDLRPDGLRKRRVAEVGQRLLPVGAARVREEALQ